MNGEHWLADDLDAALAAVIEHAALTHGYDAPAWVDEPERFLPEPVKLTGFETDSGLAWQLGAFLRRGGSIDSRDLDGRTGDGRQRTAELREGSRSPRATRQRAAPGRRTGRAVPRRRSPDALGAANRQADQRPRRRDAHRPNAADDGRNEYQPHGLEPTWANPAVTLFVPSKRNPGKTTLFSGKALTVKGASADHMLAMKIRSHRDIDLNDAAVLI